MATRNKNKDLVDDYLGAYQERLESANRDYVGEGNAVNRALLNQLFVAAGGFITLSTALLVTKETLRAFTLSHHAKYVVVGVIALSLASIFCGIAQYRKDSHFLQERRDLNAKLITDVATRKIKTIDQLVRRRESDKSKIRPRSRTRWIRAQFSCLAASGIGLIALVSYLLFIARISF